MTDEGNAELRFAIQVPAELETGTYANFLSVWHTPHDFTLDFAVTLPGEGAEGQVVVPTRVVARIKIPLTVVEDMLRALATNVSNYEASVGGRIRKPGEP